MTMLDAQPAARAEGPRPTSPLLTPQEYAEPLPSYSPDGLLHLLREAELTGRGGAAFPTFRKIAAIGNARPIVVGNAMEGEHLSSKDRVLLARNPDLVLDGLEVVANALRARRIVLALGHRIDPGPVQQAIAHRRSRVEVQQFGPGFVRGQESALVNAINGQPAVPSDKLRPVWRSGVDGRPTLVSNVETFAAAALIAHGRDARTHLVTVTASDERVLDQSGVVEYERGTSIGSVLQRCGVRPGRVRAALTGGYHGVWVTPDRFNEPLKHSIVHVLDRSRCPLKVTADIAAYLGRESAGQCGPCINGLPALAMTMSRLAAGERDPQLPAQVHRLANVVRGRGACAHPDGAARLIDSALTTFPEHVAAHLEGVCPS